MKRSTIRSIKVAKGLLVGDYVKNFNAKDIYDGEYILKKAINYLGAEPTRY